MTLVEQARNSLEGLIREELESLNGEFDAELVADAVLDRLTDEEVWDLVRRLLRTEIGRTARRFTLRALGPTTSKRWEQARKDYMERNPLTEWITLFPGPGGKKRLGECTRAELKLHYGYLLSKAHEIEARAEQVTKLIALLDDDETTLGALGETRVREALES